MFGKHVIIVSVCIITRPHPPLALHLEAGRENVSSVEEEPGADEHTCSPQAQIRDCTRKVGCSGWGKKLDRKHGLK